MSEILTTLRQEAKELRLLLPDVEQAPADWQRKLDATRLLGQGIPVEAWYLADHFLTTWADWHGLRARYSRYFGITDDFSPRWWQELDGRCKQTAMGLWDNIELQRLVAESWQQEAPGVNDQLGNRAPDDHAEGIAAKADSLARHAMSGHERMMLVSMLANGQQAAPMPMSAVVSQQTRRLISDFDHAAPETRAEIVWQLRNYRHATLQLSWLMKSNGEGVDWPPTALEHALADDERAARLAETLIEPYELRHDEDRQILTRIVRAVSEVGYEHFFDDVTSREMHGGRDSPLGAEGVEVVPGGQGGGRAAVVVALSRRGRRGASLETMLVKVSRRLADGAAARTVILLSDSWDAGLFARVARERFAEHHGRGVDFVFLVVGSPPQIVSPIPVFLNGQPAEKRTNQPLRRLTTE